MSDAVGQANPFSDASDFNSLDFIIARAFDEAQTVSIGQVKAVNIGAQTVDVQILVNLVTGSNTPVLHEVIAGRPYFRLQGGGNAIICDPVVDDIGIVVFASRDITGVVAAKGAANPPSARKFSWSDGIYLGGILNGTPAQYVQFLAAGAGINIVSPGTVAIQAPATTISGTANVAGDTTLQATLAVTGTSMLTGAVSAPGGITTTTIAAASAVFSGSVTASSFIGGGGGGGGTVTSITAGTGLSGGTITVSGTIALNSTTIAALALAVTALQSASVQDSISGAGTSGSPLQLVNDSASPGASMVYGTDGSGTKGWQTAGGGSSQPFNITPDTHPSIPTGVGLGPNDEFETGSTIDTAGTRYAGATAWSGYSLSTGFGNVAAGALILGPAATSSLNVSGYSQPVVGTTWEYTCKLNQILLGSPGAIGMFIANGLGPMWHFNIVSGSIIEVQSFNSPTSFNGTAANATIPTANTTPVYLQIAYNGTNLLFNYSTTGIPGTFINLLSTTLTGWLGAPPTLVGLAGQLQSTTQNIAMFDWFRQTA